jgi:hypothetical protein
MFDCSIKGYRVIPAKAGIQEHGLSPARQWPMFMDPGLRRDDVKGVKAVATCGTE